MKVALVQPPNTANIVRGVGHYAQHLYDALKGEGIAIEWVHSSYPILHSNFDLVHFPFFDLFFLNLPPLINKNTVVTVHDLTPIVLAEHFPRGLRGNFKWLIQKTALNFTTAIITVSQASKKDIVKITGIDPGKITVTYEAPDERFQKLSDHTKLKAIKHKLSLPDKFLLYVGDVNYNKNIPTLLSAFAKFRGPKLSKDYSLVLAGGAFVKSDLVEVKEIRRLINHLEIDNSVVFPGFVSSDDLVGLYNLAAVYIQPSIYEGFGLPVIEALACACPVICGRNSSLPEVAGDAAIYVEETNSEDINSKIISVTNTPREQFETKCLAQAAKFSWEKTAKETLKVYEKVLKNI